jgi:PAS domain S-box-containing protein
MESSKEARKGRWVGEKLAASARLSDDAIALGSRAGIIEWANPAWARVTGHALDRFTSKPVGDFLEQIDLEPDVVDFVGSCFREKKVCEIDLPLTTPAGANIWVHLRVEPLLDTSGEVSDFLVVARDITERKQAESLAGVAMVDLSTLALEMARLHMDVLGPMTDYDLALAEDIPSILANESLLEGLIGRLICRAAESMRRGWGALSLSTGLLGDGEGPLYRGNPFRGLPHGQYAYLEVHDTGSSPGTGAHQVVEEPFLSSRFPGYSMRIATARLLLQNQGGEIRLQSSVWDGTSVVLLLPYCSAPVLELV